MKTTPFVVILLAVAALVHGSSKDNGEKVSDLKISLCKECEKLAIVLKNLADDPESVIILVDSLNLLCDAAFVAPFQGICHMIVNSAGFITQQMQGLLDDPNAFCKTLHFCSTTTSTSPLNIASKHLALSVASKLFLGRNSSDQHCGLCSHSLNEIKRSLQNPDLVETYQKQAMQMCQLAAGKYEMECKDAVEQYFHSAVNVLLDMFCDPETICKDMKLCDNLSNETIHNGTTKGSASQLVRKVIPMRMFLGMDVGCMACKGGIAMAIRMIDNEESLINLANALIGMCDLVPTSFKDGCVDFMNIYSKAIIEMGLSELTPAKVCSALGACTDGYLQQMELVPLTGKSFLTCTACKLMSKVVVHQLNQDNVQKEMVDAVVSHTCAWIPGSCGYKERCESVVNTYLPYAVEDIVALTYVPKMCTAADLC